MCKEFVVIQSYKWYVYKQYVTLIHLIIVSLSHLIIMINAHSLCRQRVIVIQVFVTLCVCVCLQCVCVCLYVRLSVCLSVSVHLSVCNCVCAGLHTEMNKQHIDKVVAGKRLVTKSSFPFVVMPILLLQDICFTIHLKYDWLTIYHIH